jgi:hypothetical protein
MLCYVIVVLMKLEVVISPSNESGDWNVVVFRQPNMAHCMICLHLFIQPVNQTTARCMQARPVQPSKQGPPVRPKPGQPGPC